MWQKNNGKSETEILQNQFTAYLATAVQRRRNDYLQQMDRRQQIESLTEDFMFMPECSIEQDMLLGLPVLMQLEDSALLHTPPLYILRLRIPLHRHLLPAVRQAPSAPGLPGPYLRRRYIWSCSI